ncbi:COG3236 protein [Bacillus phage 0305phi8-36]|uniref:COG3236 protein n=1 Tax=Bacillus phage 0305phi8-36 TaxID=458639 RepID=UPI00015A1F5A|nr:COG3236 protein [Bacillus phage 0305phi8-36]ABS83792.1 COG3236 protein [Bacillus phage 0305phi8-36]
MKANIKSNAIRFYSGSDNYSEFSCMSKHPVVIAGTEYPTLEHYYHAQKFIDLEPVEEILATNNPFEARRLGQRTDYPIHEDWDVMKEHVMFVGLIHKFKQHEWLRTLLLSTGDKELIHHSDRDRYWGQSVTGKGKNRLGIMIMNVRERIKNGNLI